MPITAAHEDNSLTNEESTSLGNSLDAAERQRCEHTAPHSQSRRQMVLVYFILGFTSYMVTLYCEISHSEVGTVVHFKLKQETPLQLKTKVGKLAQD